MAVLTPAAFQRRVIQLQKYPEKVGREAVKRNAANGRDNANSAVSRATNGKALLRNAGKLERNATGFVTGKAGANLSASIQDVKRGGNPGVFVSATGPWPLINNDTKRHIISPAGADKLTLAGPTLNGRPLRSRSGRSSARGRANRSQVLRTPYGPRRFVNHPGTKGKQPWQRARAKTEAEAPVILAKVANEELRKVVR